VNVGRYNNSKGISGCIPSRTNFTSTLLRVEFTINLVPGAEAVSRTPYLTELKELKEQLEELL
jgi:hypothetical protein